MTTRMAKSTEEEVEAGAGKAETRGDRLIDRGVYHERHRGAKATGYLKWRAKENAADRFVAT